MGLRSHGTGPLLVISTESVLTFSGGIWAGRGELENRKQSLRGPWLRFSLADLSMGAIAFRLLANCLKAVTPPLSGFGGIFKADRHHSKQGVKELRFKASPNERGV